MAKEGMWQRILSLSHIDPVRGIQTPRQDDDVAAFGAQIVDELQRRIEERRPFELQWRLNQAFIAGDQYCDIYEGTGEVAALEPTSVTEIRSVYNQLAPIMEIRLSKLSRVHPGLLVRPMTADTRDVTTAKVSTRILKAAYADQEMRDKGDEMNLWSEQCGGVLLKTVWDPRAGLCLDAFDGQPVHEGDVSTTVVPYYEFFPASSYEPDLQKQDSIIHAKAYTVDEIKNRWGIEVEGKDIDCYSMRATGVTAGGLGYTNSVMSVGREILHHSELVVEYFERPSALFPEGRHAIVVGDYVVHLGTLKFKVGKNWRVGYPFAHQRCLKKAGVFWGSTVIERCIPLQRDYNALQNMMTEYLARMSIGNMAVQQNSLVDEDEFAGGILPGQMIFYREGYQPPTWLVPEEIPQSISQRADVLRQEFIIISGVSEMARSSQAPAAISSGNALEVLKEQDDTRLALTAENIRSCYVEIGKQMLRLYKQFASARRVSRVVGDDFGDIYGFMWDQNDITSDDIVVDTTNEMLNTPAQRRQAAMELLTAGLFNDPDTGRLTREGRAKVMEIYEFGNTESAIDIDEMQMANARRENMLAKFGGELEIMPYDNHSLHQAEHMKFILGAEFRELHRYDRAAAQAFMDHLEQHKEAAVQEALALSGQGGAAQMVSNGQPIDKAISAGAENVGGLGAGQ